MRSSRKQGADQADMQRPDPSASLEQDRQAHALAFEVPSTPHLHELKHVLGPRLRGSTKRHCVSHGCGVRLLALMADLSSSDYHVNIMMFQPLKESN